MNIRETNKAIGVISCVMMIVWLVVVGGLGWAAVHFIRRFW